MNGTDIFSCIFCYNDKTRLLFHPEQTGKILYSITCRDKILCSERIPFIIPGTGEYTRPAVFEKKRGKAGFFPCVDDGMTFERKSPFHDSGSENIGICIAADCMSTREYFRSGYFSVKGFRHFFLNGLQKIVQLFICSVIESISSAHDFILLSNHREITIIVLMNERSTVQKRDKAERKRRIGKEIQYFLMVLFFYIFFYLVLFFLFQAVNIVISLNPMIRLIVYLMLFMIDYLVTGVFVRSKGFMTYIINGKRTI